MWERLFGVQVGGLWAFVQFLELTALVLVVLWVLSKIEINNKEREKENGSNV
mgnify:CR=1 FL=1